MPNTQVHAVQRNISKPNAMHSFAGTRITAGIKVQWTLEGVDKGQSFLDYDRYRFKQVLRLAIVTISQHTQCGKACCSVPAAFPVRLSCSICLTRKCMQVANPWRLR